MQPRRNEYDVTNRVNTTDPLAVHQEVTRIYLGLYPDAPTETLGRAFGDCARLFRGDYPGYRACDTAYHNLQHTLDVALAMARLMDGYDRSARARASRSERACSASASSPRCSTTSATCAIATTPATRTARSTRCCHVSRGSRFVEHYMSRLGMSDLAPVAASIIHFTGYEMPVDTHRGAEPDVPPARQHARHRRHHRPDGGPLLSGEVPGPAVSRVRGGRARVRRPAATPQGAARFSSAQDLLCKTPAFYSTAKHRLNELLGGAYGYAETHFGGQNLYLDEVMKNIRHAERVAEKGDVVALLRRNPPPREPSAAFVAREPERVQRASMTRADCTVHASAICSC